MITIAYNALPITVVLVHQQILVHVSSAQMVTTQQMALVRFVHSPIVKLVT